MSIVDDDDDDDDESSSDDDVAPSQNENEDYGGGGGDDAFSQHSPTSPDTQNMPDAYPDLELLAVSHAEEEDEDADEADGGHSSDSGSRRSPCPPDYDVELYGSVSSESEDEVKGLAKDPGKLGRGATIYPAAETHEAQGSHLIVTLNERKNEAEKNKAEKKEKEKEVVNCPNWPHLPFRRPYSHLTGHRAYSTNSHECNCHVPHIAKSTGPDPLWEGGYSGSTKREEKNASLFAAKACGPEKGRVFTSDCSWCEKRVNHEARRF